jgi:hypothetical protein
MSADGGTVKCLFCNYSTRSTNAADEYVANALGYKSRYAVEKDGGEWPLRTCPDCCSETYVTAIPGVCDTKDGYCFTCGQEHSAGELEDCNYCGELYDPGEEKGFHICTDCFQARVNKDD